MNFEGKQQSLLTFRVGPVLCCAPSLPVRSIITPPKLTHTPGSDSSQPGIFKHGSHIVKVIDLRQKFGIDEAEQTHPGNLIITIFEDGGFSFWVDQILDVFDFPTEGWGNVPAAIPRGVFTKTLLLNNKIHLYSEFEKLATINDLGYLKHYIQQLKQQQEIKKPVKSKPESSQIKTASLSTTTNKQTVSPMASTIKNDTVLTTHSTKPASNNTFTTPIKTVKNSQSSKKSLTDKKTDLSPVATNTQRSKPAALNTAVTNKKTILKNTVGEVTKTTSNPGIKKPLQTVPIVKASSTQTKTNYVKETNCSEQESSSTGIIIFFLFMFSLLATGFYYLFFNEDTNNSKYKQPTIVKKYEPIKYEETQSVVKIETPITPAIENNVLHNIPEENEQKSKEYKADISQQNNEITITIHQPISVEENLKEKALLKEAIKVESEMEVEISVATTPTKILTEKETTQELAKEIIINEVIHTVVKGDTLWAIAKKYVDNPFLYPELARLSNIKNPHRIYPGNRVRIRFIKR